MKEDCKHKYTPIWVGTHPNNTEEVFFQFGCDECGESKLGKVNKHPTIDKDRKYLTHLYSSVIAYRLNSIKDDTEVIKDTTRLLHNLNERWDI